MPLELIDVLDSAVKIGLGAVIGAYATYKSTKLNHLNERNKELRTHKIKTIEMVAEKCELFFNSYANFKNRLAGALQKRATDKEYPLSESMKKALKEVDGNLFPAVESANIAIARLSLLRAEKAKNEIEIIIKSIGEFRNRIMLEDTLPSKENFNKFKSEMSEAINRFQNELATIYEDIS